MLSEHAQHSVLPATGVMDECRAGEGAEASLRAHTTYSNLSPEFLLPVTPRGCETPGYFAALALGAVGQRGKSDPSKFHQ